MEQDIKWQLVRREDLTTLLEIENNPDNSKFIMTWTESQYENALLSTDNRIFLLIQDENPIGYALMCGFDNPYDNIELKRLAIQIKGKGIGKKAMKSLMYYVFETCGKRKMWLHYFDYNVVGANLYKSLGFVQEGRRREETIKKGELHDLFLMGLLKREYEAISKTESFDMIRFEE